MLYHRNSRFETTILRLWFRADLHVLRETLSAEGRVLVVIGGQAEGRCGEVAVRGARLGRAS